MLEELEERLCLYVHLRHYVSVLSIHISNSLSGKNRYIFFLLFLVS